MPSSPSPWFCLSLEAHQGASIQVLAKRECSTPGEAQDNPIEAKKKKKVLEVLYIFMVLKIINKLSFTNILYTDDHYPLSIR